MVVVVVVVFVIVVLVVVVVVVVVVVCYKAMILTFASNFFADVKFHQARTRRSN